MSFNFINDKDKKVHFIGIGGISMSGLAAVLLNSGFKVSGSDFKDSHIVEKLRLEGAEIYIGHRKENIKDDVDLVVYTAAIPSDNPELLEAKNRDITLMDRAEFLGHIMQGHKYNVAISGTHGKTTCTSMLSHITLAGNLDPTILIGGELDVIDGNFRIGNSEYFLTEACEYKRSFLKFFPYVGVILNVDADHLDYYKDIDEIQDTFSQFSKLIPSNGYLVGYANDPRVKKILEDSKCNTISYGFENADVTAKNIVFNNKGCASFDVYENDKLLFNISLNVPGKHNVLNALASICVSLIFNISNDAVATGLSNCKGAHKRFEYKGELNGVTVIDDYAHHPTEIKATLSTAKQIKHNKMYCVFQPHTYTRTKALFDEFTNCFSDADELILMDIYAAREKDNGLVSSDELGDAIRKTGLKCVNVHSHDEAVKYLQSKLTNDDLLLTVGAGDVVIVGEKYLENK